MWLFDGLGAMAGVYAVFDLANALFALIPIRIGLAHLIYYFVEGKKEPQLNPTTPAGGEVRA